MYNESGFSAPDFERGLSDAAEYRIGSERRPLSEVLVDVGQEYDYNLSPEVNLARYRVAQRLVETGFLRVKSGRCFFNYEGSGGKGLSSEEFAVLRLWEQQMLNLGEVAEALQYVYAVVEDLHAPVNESAIHSEESMHVKPIMALPKDKNSLGQVYSLDKILQYQAVFMAGNDFTFSSPSSTLSLENGEKVERRGLVAAEKLFEIGVPYNVAETEEYNWNRWLLCKHLIAQGIMRVVDGELVVDIDVLRNGWSGSKRFLNFSANIGKVEMLHLLEGLKVYDSQEVAKVENDLTRCKVAPLLRLPRSIEEAMRSSAIDAGQGERPHMQPWELGQNTQWSETFTLADGKTINLGELAVAEALRDLGARRSEDGTLYVCTGDEGEMEKFSLRKFVVVSGVNPVIRDKNDKVVSLRNNGYEFVRSHLSNLEKYNVLQSGDIRRMTTTETGAVFGANEKKIPKNGMVTIRSGVGPMGGTARYFLGKSSNVLNTDFGPEQLSVIQLDPYTAALVQNGPDGVRTVIRTINLLTDLEIQQRHESVLSQNPNVTQSELGSRVVVTKEQMEGRVSKYDLTKLLPKYPSESAEQYARRLSEIPSPDDVFNKMRLFFSDLHVPIHTLPWSQQLTLARVLREGRNADQLQIFLTTFGWEGLNALLSCEINPSLAQTVMEIGRALPKDDASKVFEKAGAILANVQGAGEELENGLSLEPETVLAMKQGLFKKVEELLAQIAVKHGRSEERVGQSIEEELDAYNVKTIRFLQRCKALRQTGNREWLERFAEVDLEELSGPELQKKPELVQEMLRIYGLNYKEYEKTTPELPSSLLMGFKQKLSDSNSIFRGYRQKSDGAVMSFCRLDTEGQSVHLAAVNTNPAFAGGLVGDIMIEQVYTETLSEGKQLHLETIPTTNIAKRYIGMGGVATALDFHVETRDGVTRNIPILRVEVSQDTSLRYNTKRLLQSPGAVLDFARRGTESETEKVINISSAAFQSGSREQYEAWFMPLSAGYVLTQFVEESGIIRLVFEKSAGAV